MVEEVSDDFDNITLEGVNTDIRLDFNALAGYHYAVDLEKGKSFKIPTSGNKLSKENTLGDYKQYEGDFKTANKSLVKIVAKNSYITFGTAD